MKSKTTFAGYILPGLFLLFWIVGCDAPPLQTTVRALSIPPVAHSLLVTPQDATGLPWLGLGVEWDVENGDQSAPLMLTNGQWNTLLTRVDYIRPSLIRSMISISWFCPDGTLGSYTFDSPLMQAWYQLLDHAKAQHITVIIGTWDHGPWEYTSHSYAQAMADLLTYLIVVKGYTNIQYFNGVNEPDYQPHPISYQDWQTALTNLTAALRQQGLLGKVALLGPDTNGQWVTNGTVAKQDQELLGGYEWHDYESSCCTIANDTLEARLKQMAQQLSLADSGKKPLLLGEMGWAYQKRPGDNQRQVVNYAYGLSMADYAVQLARAGVSGASAWDLDDAMHNKEWGMWESANHPQLRPWFYSWSLLSRYLPAGATIYAPKGSLSGLRVLVARIADPLKAGRSHWTVVLVNRRSTSEALRVVMPQGGSGLFLHYTYSDGNRPVDKQGFPRPSGQMDGSLESGILLTAPANSMTLFTTFSG